MDNIYHERQRRTQERRKQHWTLSLIKKRYRASVSYILKKKQSSWLKETKFIDWYDKPTYVRQTENSMPARGEEVFSFCRLVNRVLHTVDLGHTSFLDVWLNIPCLLWIPDEWTLRNAVVDVVNGSSCRTSLDLFIYASHFFNNIDNVHWWSILVNRS